MNSEELPPIIWVRKNKDKLVKFIQNLVQIPSVSGEEEEIQKFIYKKFGELDLNPKFVHPDVEILQKSEDYFETTSYTKFGYKNRPNVVGILKGIGSGKSICLNGHIDVVSPEPIEQWTRDPWGGEIEGDFIYGRGAGDMKAGVASIIFALQALKETKTRLNGDVFIETTIEEEDGGVGGAL
ncbi:MAG: M20/M25/M40 family metallo-hydrolase, partial [Candidatus Bathyarchaeota archaeon]|nr:M20/M25/M40 family metallo-hydrolase [Candidatus Bathyarchaeota archaeon]